MNTTEIDNNADILDSREIIDRIAELKAEDERDEDEQQELNGLVNLAKQLEGYCDDWGYGVTLIHDTYFEDYAKELAWEIGAISPDHTWPLNCIDWEQAARDLQMDYTYATFNGEIYWAR